jgi:hypothetical protein
MRNRIFLNSVIIFVALFVTLSCSKSRTVEIPTPDYVIPDDTLALMFEGIHKIDATLTTNSISDKGAYSRINLYFSLFEKYNTTEDIFNETVRHYTLTDIQHLHDIYDQVLGKLNQEKGELTKELMED